MLRGQPLQANFQRILAWCVVSGVLAVAGGIVTGPARGWLWLAAVGVDTLGGVVGFYTPGLGRSATTVSWAQIGAFVTAVVAAWACGGCTSTAALKLAVWRVVSWPRVAAIAVLGLLGLVAGRLPALALELCAAAVVVSVAAVDYRAHPDARSREAPAA